MKIDDTLKQLRRSSELLLETRAEHEVFEPYLPDGLMTKVYHVNMGPGDVDGPISIRVSKNQTVLDFKEIVARKLIMNAKHVVLALNDYKEGSKILSNNDASLRDENIIDYSKVFVTVNNPEDDDFGNKFKQFVARLDHLIGIYFVLPNMDPGEIVLNRNLQILLYNLVHISPNRYAEKVINPAPSSQSGSAVRNRGDEW